MKTVRIFNFEIKVQLLDPWRYGVFFFLGESSTPVFSSKHKSLRAAVADSSAALDDLLFWGSETVYRAEILDGWTGKTVQVEVVVVHEITVKRRVHREVVKF